MRKRQDEYVQAYKRKDMPFLSSLIMDYKEIFENVLLDESLVQAQFNDFRSWVESLTLQQKNYTDGFTYYVLLTFYRKWMLENHIPFLIDLNSHNLKQIQINYLNEDFEQFIFWLYKTIDIHQYLAFKIKNKPTLSSEIGKEFGKFKNHIDKNILTLFKDLEIKFSLDNVKGWRDKFTEKVEIQIFWKKKLIKVPLCFETSTDAQVELFESNKDNVSYELRVMPLSISNRSNKSGNHFVEFDLKPEELRFSKLINFALKKKFHFTLPTKENSQFQLIVKPSNFDKNKIKQGFAQNTCSSLKKALNNWCRYENFEVAESLQTQQTQQTQDNTSKYKFQLSVDLKNINIIENKTEKLLQIELNLKTLYFDDSLDKPRWVRKKQDSFKYSNKITSIENLEDVDLFETYCADLLLNPDFQKVMRDLLNNSLK